MARRIALVAAAASVIMPAGTASAGRLLATGHDADHHCGRGELVGGQMEYRQCGFFKVSVDYVRAGAPDPAKPLLVPDRGQNDVVAALSRSFPQGAPPHVLMDPRSAEFAAAPITVDRYSAVVIASSGGDESDTTQQDLNDLDSTPDSDAINARADVLRAFFDAGGGIYANSGSVHGDDADAPYYGFLPISVQGAAVNGPFALTELGAAIGFPAADINCCVTHNTFGVPSPDSALRAAETDSAGRVVTLVADTPRFTSLGEPKITPAVVQEVSKGLPSARSCVRRTSVTLKLRRPTRLRYDRATVYVNGKVAKRVRGARITRSIKLKMPRTGNQAKVRVVIVTTGKRKITVRRTYRICS